MNRNDVNRRAILAGVGGAVASSLILQPAQAASPKKAADLQAVLDKIARTDRGFGESCLPVQAFPGSGRAAFTLAGAGSYYLSENVLAAAGQNGIEITGDNIDLDLQGYSVIGAQDAPAGTGILVTGQNVTIYDGSVVGFVNGVDLENATLSVCWDVTASGALDVGFLAGTRCQFYDCDAYEVIKGAGFLARLDRTLFEECGAFSCASGFSAGGVGNLFLSNSATDCFHPFEFGSGNAWGPIVVVKGDMSLLRNGNDPNANHVY